MRELAELGYLVREKVQNELGQWSTIQTIYEEPVVSPGPEEPTRGGADDGKPGARISTEKSRNETNRAPRALNVPLSPDIAGLAAACSHAGLTATFAYLKPDAAESIAELLEAHGVAQLVAAAKAVHRPSDPMRFAQAWIPLWQGLAVPQVAPRVARDKCGKCDEYGWLPDDDFGRAVRCACRVVAA